MTSILKLFENSPYSMVQRYAQRRYNTGFLDGIACRGTIALMLICHAWIQFRCPSCLQGGLSGIMAVRGVYMLEIFRREST